MSSCAFLRAKLAQTVSRLAKSSPVEQGAAIVKAGYLANPKTFLKNTAGNAAMAGFDTFVQQPTAAALDYLMSVGRSASTGFTIKPHEFRQVASTLSQAGLRYAGQGFKEGTAKAVEYLRTGVDPEFVNQKFDLQHVHVTLPGIGKAVQAVMDVMEASDKPWFGFATNLSLYTRAKVLAIREGLTGDAQTARVNQLLANPTDEMVAGALEDAQYATFKNRTVLGQAAAQIKESFRRAGQSASERLAHPRRAAAKRVTGQTLYGLSEVTLPFTSVPTAIAGVALDYSPIGFVKTLALQLPKESRGQASIAQGLAKAGLGTTATFALGYALAKSGKITGSLPTNPSERAEWEAENKQPNSVLFHGRWYSLMPIAPMSLPALLGANLWQASRENPDAGVGAQLGQVAAYEGKTMTEQTFLQGVQQLTDALSDPLRNGPRFAAGLVPVPSLAGQVAAGLDPNVRVTNGVAQQLQRKVPGASQALPPRIDQFGQPVVRHEGGAGGFAKELLDITSSRPAKGDVVTRELDRLRVFPGLPGKTVRMMGQTVQRTPQDMQQLLAAAGPQLHQALAATIANPGYQALPDEQKADVLRKVMEAVRSAANTQFKAGAVQRLRPK